MKWIAFAIVLLVAYVFVRGFLRSSEHNDPGTDLEARHSGSRNHSDLGIGGG